MMIVNSGVYTSRSVAYGQCGGWEMPVQWNVSNVVSSTTCGAPILPCNVLLRVVYLTMYAVNYIIATGRAYRLSEPGAQKQ